MATEEMKDVKPMTPERFKEINGIINGFKREFVDANAGFLYITGIDDPDNSDFIHSNSCLMGSSQLLSIVLFDLVMTDPEWREFIFAIVREAENINPEDYKKHD